MFSRSRATGNIKDGKRSEQRLSRYDPEKQRYFLFLEHFLREKTELHRAVVPRRHPCPANEHPNTPTERPPQPLCSPRTAFAGPIMFCVRSFRGLNLGSRVSLALDLRALAVVQPPRLPAPAHVPALLPRPPASLLGYAGTGTKGGQWKLPPLWGVGGVAAAATSDSDDAGAFATPASLTGAPARGSAAAGSATNSKRPRRGGTKPPPTYNPGQAEQNDTRVAAKLAALAVIGGKYETTHAAAKAYGHGLEKNAVNYWHRKLANEFDRRTALVCVKSAAAQPFTPPVLVDANPP